MSLRTVHLTPLTASDLPCDTWPSVEYQRVRIDMEEARPQRHVPAWRQPHVMLKKSKTLWHMRAAENT